MFRYDESHPNPTWIPETNFNSFLASEVTSKNLVIKEQTLVPGALYRITVDVRSPDGTMGWSAYRFETSAAPFNGTCLGVQLDRETVGMWFNISCHGWRDKMIPLTYEFSRELYDGQFDLLSYGVRPFSVIHFAPLVGRDTFRFKVAIVNLLGSSSEIYLLIKVGRVIARDRS